MLTLRRTCRYAAGIALLVCAGVGLGARIWSLAHSATLPTVPTAASFSLSVARSRNDGHARAVAAGLAAMGLPAFTRPLRNGDWRQVLVGPYVSIDEADAVQRLLGAYGYPARLVVDESLRRVPGGSIPRVRRDAGVAVLLVAGAGRVAVVLELPSEPRQTLTRRTGGEAADTLAIDLGPVASPADPQLWAVPEDARIIQRISVEDVEADGRHFVRARLAIAPPSVSSVRVVGRRVYVDLWEPATIWAGGAGEASGAGRPSAVGTVARQDASDSADPLPDSESYHAIVRPALARLERIEPFLLAAAAAPTAEVLAALAGTLDDLAAWLDTVDPPPESRNAHAHAALLDAIGRARYAVEPGFTGDRVAQGRDAFRIVQGIRAQLSPGT